MILGKFFLKYERGVKLTSTQKNTTLKKPSLIRVKSKCGKDSEVANARMQSLISLPTITSSNPYKINEFYEKPVTHLQALDTMGKLK